MLNWCPIRRQLTLRFVVFRLCNQNPTLSQRQIDVNPIFIFNQNATSVWRHVHVNLTLHRRLVPAGDLHSIWNIPFKSHDCFYFSISFSTAEHAQAGAYSMMSVLHDKATVKKEELYEVVGNNDYRINNLLDEKYEPCPVREILRDAHRFLGKNFRIVCLQGTVSTLLQSGDTERKQSPARYSCLAWPGILRQFTQVL